MKLGIKAALSIFALLFGAAPVWASAPNVLTYQGRLLESGIPVTGPRAVQFRVCDDAAGVTCSAAVVTDPVVVTNGLYRVVFNSPVDLSNGLKFLEVRVGPDAGNLTLLLPREQLTSSAYSIYASTANLATKATTLVAAAPNDFGAFVSTHVLITGGTLGIGTSSTLFGVDLRRDGPALAAAFGATGAGSTTPRLRLRRSLGSIGTPTALMSGFVLGDLDFHGHDGTNFAEGAFIRALADEDWTTPSHATRMTFATTPSGGAVAQERMRIDNAGNVSIGTAGASGIRFDVQKDAGEAVAALSGYGVTPGARMLLRQARGTQVSPTNSQNNDTLGELEWAGHDGAAGFALGAKISAQAAQSWSNTAHGTSLMFSTVRIGQTAFVDRLFITDDGGVGVGPNPPAGSGVRLDVAGPVTAVSSLTVTGNGHLHVVAGASPPVVSACNVGVVGTLDAGSADVAGKIVFNSGGGATTTCTITFGNSWGASTPICIVQGLGAPLVSSLSAAALVVAGSWSTVGDNFSYICIGR